MSLFDSRCLHAGDGNDSPQRRVRFYTAPRNTLVIPSITLVSGSTPSSERSGSLYFYVYHQVLFYCSFIRAEHAPVQTRGTLIESYPQPQP